MFKTLIKELSTTQIIALGFLGTIFIGALFYVCLFVLPMALLLLSSMRYLLQLPLSA